METTIIPRAALQQLAGLTREVTSDMHGIVHEARAATGSSLVDDVATVRVRRLGPGGPPRHVVNELVASGVEHTRMRTPMIWKSILMRADRDLDPLRFLRITGRDPMVSAEQQALEGALDNLGRVTSALASGTHADPGVRRIVDRLGPAGAELRESFRKLDRARVDVARDTQVGWAGRSDDGRTILARTEGAPINRPYGADEAMPAVTRYLTAPSASRTLAIEPVEHPIRDQIANLGALAHRLEDAATSTSRAAALAAVDEATRAATRAVDDPADAVARQVSERALHAATTEMVEALPTSIRALGREAMSLAAPGSAELRVDLARMQDLHALALARLEALEAMASAAGRTQQKAAAAAVPEARAALATLDDEITRLYAHADATSHTNVDGATMAGLAVRVGSLSTPFAWRGTFGTSHVARGAQLHERAVGLFDELAERVQRPVVVLRAHHMSGAAIDDAIDAALRIPAGADDAAPITGAAFGLD